MPMVKIKNLENQDVGELDLSDSVFGAEIRYHLLHEVVRMQRAKKRSGTACAKERAAVIGGGQKPYRQKGTGRARQGSRRAPNHVGGGTIFGPRPRSYAFLPPKRVRRGAMRSALSLFLSQNRLIVVDDFRLKEIKTKGLMGILEKLGAARAVLCDESVNTALRLSARNLPLHHFLPPEGLNVYDLLRHDQLVISQRAAIDVQKRLDSPIRNRRADT